jgi:hypothetical protein
MLSKKEGCETIFQEKASGAQRERPKLKGAVAFMDEDDNLVVGKLARLDRSMKQRIEMVESFEGRSIGLKLFQILLIPARPRGSSVSTFLLPCVVHLLHYSFIW